MVDTYEIRKSNVVEGEDEEDCTVLQRGQTKSARVDYLSNHPKSDTHTQIQHADHHNYMTNIIGQWFPR